MSCKCHGQDSANSVFIACALDECTLQIGQLRKETEEAITNKNADPQTLLGLVLDLSVIVKNLIIVNQVSSGCVLDLEKQMEELKKRLPVDDGK